MNTPKAKRKRRVFAAIILFILVLVVFAAGRQFFPYTPGIRGGVAVLESVDIGGMKQWILARGADPSLPVLLWLHGGPGAAQMPVARPLDGVLEREFIVVHWDQRGAGKSNPPGFDESTMTFRQYCDDVRDMTQYLKKRFGKERIYLAGHSWGTEIGLAAASAHPEDYFAYIAVSQVVSPAEGDRVAHDWLLRRMENTGDQAGLAALEAIGQPPYMDQDDFVRFIKLLDAHGGGMDAPLGRLMLAALGSTEYRLSDYFQWLDGANRGSGPMWEEMLAFDAPEQYPALDVPVYFISGIDDYNTPLSLVREYYESLDAPKGKRLIVFEQSAHLPFIAEPQKFLQELAGIKSDTLKQAVSTR